MMSIRGDLELGTWRVGVCARERSDDALGCRSFNVCFAQQLQEVVLQKCHQFV